MKRFFMLLHMSVCAFLLYAQAPDSIRASLITCSPGKQIYQLYGHTALRMENFTQGQDLVFNYGVFSFEQPHFVWRFVRGECDYMVMPIPWEYFPLEYMERGSAIHAQELDLTPAEANKLWALLIDNCRPEHREYRYNFLFNNCTSRVRDMLEQAVDGKIAYPQLEEKKTYRQIIHEYATPGSLEAEAQDLLLGAKIDTILSDRATMFAPEYLKWFVASARVYATDGSLRPLMKGEATLLQARHIATPQPRWQQILHKPVWPAWGFAAICLLLLLLERRIGHMMWLLDIPLLLLQGLAGCLILFLGLCSLHPGVDANWQLWPFSPLALLALPRVVVAAARGKRCWWHTLHLLYLTFFLLFSHWISQQFGQIVIPLALAFLTRPLSYHFYYNTKKL